MNFVRIEQFLRAERAFAVIPLRAAARFAENLDVVVAVAHGKIVGYSAVAEDLAVVGELAENERYHVSDVFVAESSFIVALGIEKRVALFVRHHFGKLLVGYFHGFPDVFFRSEKGDVDARVRARIRKKFF